MGDKKERAKREKKVMGQRKRGREDEVDGWKKEEKGGRGREGE